MTLLHKRDFFHLELLFVAFKRKFNISPGTDLIILSAALFGVTIVITKNALTDLGPLTLLSIQTASSVMLFWTIIICNQIKIPLNLNSFKTALGGLLEPGLSYLFGVFGLSLTSASNSSLINTIEPFVTIILSWLILGESLNPSLITLGLVTTMGVIFVALPDLASIGDGSMIGNCLIFISVLFAALYTVTTSISVKNLPPVVVAALQQTTALILFVIMTFVAFSLNLETFTMSATTGKSLLITIISGAFGYGLAFLLYLKAITYQSATRISLYLSLIPIFAVLSAYLFLGERFILIQIFGGCLIVATIAGISQLPHPKH